MSESQQKWLRRASLIVLPPKLNEGDADSQDQTTQQGLDLSSLRFTFQVSQADTTAPNNATIRVYNLSDTTVKRARGEFSRVVLSAGYESSSFGVIFRGDVKQYRIGKENATDSYLDLLCADGDLSYNFGLINKSFAAGTTARQIMEAAATAMGAPISHLPDLEGINPEFARGKVAFGMARDLMTRATDTAGATWSIQNGKVQILKLQGYLPGEAVVVNSLTGMIGIPQQTDQGIYFSTLLDPKLNVGGLVVLNNKDINRLEMQSNTLPVQFNQWTGIQYASKIAEGADGLYRLYVVEHTGDSRGNPWYSNCVCLAVDKSDDSVLAKN